MKHLTILFLHLLLPTFLTTQPPLSTTPDLIDILSTSSPRNKCEERSRSCGHCTADPDCGFCQEWLGEGSSPAFEESCLPGNDDQPDDNDRQCRTSGKNWFYENCNDYVAEDSGKKRDTRYTLSSSTGTLENPPPAVVVHTDVTTPITISTTSSSSILELSSKQKIKDQAQTNAVPIDMTDPFRDPSIPIRAAPYMPCCQVCVSQFYKATDFLETNEVMKTKIIHRFHAWRVQGGPRSPDTGKPHIDERILPDTHYPAAAGTAATSTTTAFSTSRKRGSSKKKMAISTLKIRESSRTKDEQRKKGSVTEQGTAAATLQSTLRFREIQRRKGFIPGGAAKGGAGATPPAAAAAANKAGAATAPKSGAKSKAAASKKGGSAAAAKGGSKAGSTSDAKAGGASGEKAGASALAKTGAPVGGSAKGGGVDAKAGAKAGAAAKAGVPLPPPGVGGMGGGMGGGGMGGGMGGGGGMGSLMGAAAGGAALATSWSKLKDPGLNSIKMMTMGGCACHSTLCYFLFLCLFAIFLTFFFFFFFFSSFSFSSSCFIYPSVILSFFQSLTVCAVNSVQLILFHRHNRGYRRTMAAVL